MIRIAFAIALIFCHFPAFVSAGESGETALPMSWWAVRKEIGETIDRERITLADYAGRVLQGRPENAHDSLIRIAVCLSAGLGSSLREEMATLKSLAPDIPNSFVEGMYYQAFDELKSPESALQIVEVFSASLTELCLDNRLLKHFSEKGWTVDRIDEWLEKKGFGKDGFWLKERFAFNARQGTQDRVFAVFFKQIRERPENLVVPSLVLDALVRAKPWMKERVDLSWLPETVCLRKASEMEAFASRLAILDNWKAAADFYSRAIATPLQPEELNGMAMMFQIAMPSDRLKAIFGAGLREGLAECLLKMGKKDEAQAFMVEADDIRRRHNLAANARFSGQVQALTGERTIEQRIVRQEPASENDPQYWLKRAQYFRGRQDSAAEEEALKKGLAASSPDEPQARGKKSGIGMKSVLLSQFSHFLKRNNRSAEAVSLLHAEIASFPLSPTADRSASLLTMEFPGFLNAEDVRLWNWLDGRLKWEYNEERLLWELLKSVDKPRQEEFFKKAEALAREKDPSRESALGWIMNRMGFPEISIPVLERALKRSTDRELSEKISFTLFESFLDGKDWKRAEKAFPTARQRLSPAERSEWLARIAAVASEAGAKSDAVRIWREVMAMNPSETRGLESLKKAGLKMELEEIYQQLSRELPDSDVPARVLEFLQKNH
jgi:tetratricopeptide (TPR) repeat protein